MTKLTEQMVKARNRKRQCDLANLRELNCWGSGITDISIAAKMTSIQVLALSSNKIDTLKHFKNCYHLQELYLRDNEIKDLSELKYLQYLPNLRILSLTENPCCINAGKSYRRKVLEILPNLTKLDTHDVLSCELQDVRCNQLRHEEQQSHDIEQNNNNFELEKEPTPPPQAQPQPPRAFNKNQHVRDRDRCWDQYNHSPSLSHIPCDRCSLKPSNSVRERRSQSIIDDQPFTIPRPYSRSSNTNVNMDLHLYSNNGSNSRMSEHRLGNDYISSLYEGGYPHRKQFYALTEPLPGVSTHKISRPLFIALNAIFKELDYDGLKVLDDALHYQMNELINTDDFRR